MSNKKTRLQKNKGERERLRVKKEKERLDLEDRQEVLFKDEPTLETEETEVKAESEELEKDYHYAEAYNSPMMTGPTSFEELDEMREMAEKAHHVDSVAYDVQDLVRNILHDMELEPTEKADRIMDVADEFAQRVDSVLMDEDMQKDMDVLQIEAILGTYDRHTSLLEKGRDWAEDLIKRKLSGKARKRLEDSEFALPAKRKYPIHDKAHVRNALARAAQMMQRGGEAAADAKAALPKIRAAAKRMGIEMGMEKSSILIEKDKSGQWRWIGKPSNNFIDHQLDIISKAAHAAYCDWLTGNPDQAPVFMTWHVPGTAREAAADFWMEHEGALIMSGKLTEPEAAALLKQQAKYDLGMSLQGSALRLDKEDKRVITNYWLFEVSDLPQHRAANPFTELGTMLTKEVSMNDQEKIEYLASYMGSVEKAKAFLDKTGKVQKELQEAGITSKEKAEDEVKPPAAKVETPEPVDGAKLTAQIVEAVGKEFDFEGLNAFVASAQEAMQKVPLLESALKELTVSKEDELVEILTPPAAKFAWSMENRPSTNDKTKLKKDDEADEKLEKAQPGVPDDYWFSRLTETTPVQEV